MSALFPLTRIPWIKTILVNRWLQLIVRSILLGLFLLVILAGWIGTPSGNHNLSIILVWIIWWGLLILFAVPLFGRGWCNVCPIPLVGEWLQNKSLMSPIMGSRSASNQRKWNKSFQNIWLQNILFVGMAIFSVHLLTQPGLTAWLLFSLFIVATITGVLYQRRVFCRHICPVSGFIGLFSQLAPLEVRVVDPKICLNHQPKTCYTGNEVGFGCPWNIYPAALDKNTNCGTCMECLRSCPYDNMAVNLRSPGADLRTNRLLKFDEIAKAFIMLGSAMVYAVVLLGPWSTIKMSALAIGSTGWWVYVLSYLTLVFLILPGGFYLAVQLSTKSSSHAVKVKTFRKYTPVLIPLGLTAWIAFSLSFVLTNFSYLFPVISDPFGWGWNLFGTTNIGWTPYLTQITPWFQAGTLLVGLLWSCNSAILYRSPQESRNTVLSIILYCTLITIGLLWLLIG